MQGGMQRQPDLPPELAASQLVAQARNTPDGKLNPWRVAEVSAWAHQEAAGGAKSPGGPYWAAVAFAIDDEYRKMQRGEKDMQA